MASQHYGDGQPGADAGGERVFCHSCEHEWMRDMYGLICPSCHSDFTEIMTPSMNDRNNGPPSSTSSGDYGMHRGDTDSDPGEMDIEDQAHYHNHHHHHQHPHRHHEHHHGPSGFHVHRSVWQQSDHGSPSPAGGRQPPDPNNGDQIMDRFVEMLAAFGAGGLQPRGNRTPGSNPDGMGAGTRRPWAPPGFENAPAGGNNDGSGNNEANSTNDGTGSPFTRHGANVRTFTSRHGNGGYTSFTIATTPMSLRNLGNPNAESGNRGAGDQEPRDDFQTMFNDIWSGVGPPQHGGNGPHTFVDHGEGPPGIPAGQNLAAGLQQILRMLAPWNGQMGDAVYTQEALDRIISSMMEQNPQRGAAPPASETAIRSLDRKKVDDATLREDPKAECTICIEGLKLGDELVMLPCKHWFHDECVVMWLKEHNTCPICRAAIEDPNAAAQGNQAPRGSDPGNTPPGQTQPSQAQPPGPGPGFPPPSSSAGGQQPPTFPAQPGVSPSPGANPGGQGPTQFPPPQQWRQSHGGGSYSVIHGPFHYDPEVLRNFVRAQDRGDTSVQLPLPRLPSFQSAGSGTGPTPPPQWTGPMRPPNLTRGSSRSTRRHSNSPPNTTSSGRSRQRSPVSSWEQSREQGRQNSQSEQGHHHSGPINWIRNRLSRGGGGGSSADDGGSSDREERRHHR